MKGAVNVIIRDHEGSLVAGMTKHTLDSSSLMAEALALKDVMFWLILYL